jgi:hypothetical protein
MHIYTERNTERAWKHVQRWVEKCTLRSAHSHIQTQPQTPRDTQVSLLRDTSKHSERREKGRGIEETPNETRSYSCMNMRREAVKGAHTDKQTDVHRVTHIQVHSGTCKKIHDQGHGHQVVHRGKRRTAHAHGLSERRTLHTEVLSNKQRKGSNTEPHTYRYWG